VSTTAFAVKRALFTQLRAQAGAGQLFDGIDVAYSWPGQNDVGRRCIYGGGMRGPQVAAAVDGKASVKQEDVSIGVYLRAVVDIGALGPLNSPGVAEADQLVDDMADRFGSWLHDHADFAGPSTRAQITYMLGDYSNTDAQAIAVCTFTLTVTTFFEP
jgi:hypothetical protein